MGGEGNGHFAQTLMRTALRHEAVRDLQWPRA